MTASDGLTARESGPWAKEKLEQVQHYMSIFTNGMFGQWKGALVFLDLMSGPGLCVDRETRAEFPGSPLLALRTPRAFRSVVCVEADEACAAALHARLSTEPRGATATVVHGDANAASTIAQLRAHADRSLAFAFVDLIGQEVTFETIRALTAGRNVDLLFSFPEMDLQRNSPLAQAVDAERWNRFFGTTAWQTIVAGPRHGRVLQLRTLYEQQLQTLGYSTLANRVPMKNSRGRSIYRPLFASRHSRGLDFYRKTSAFDPGGQRPLF